MLLQFKKFLRSEIKAFFVALKRCLNPIFKQLPQLVLWLVCWNNSSTQLRLITWLHG